MKAKIKLIPQPFKADKEVVVIKMSRKQAQGLINILALSERLTEPDMDEHSGRATYWGQTTSQDEKISQKIFDALEDIGFRAVDKDGD